MIVKIIKLIKYPLVKREIKIYFLVEKYNTYLAFICFLPQLRLHKKIHSMRLLLKHGKSKRV